MNKKIYLISGGVFVAVGLAWFLVSNKFGSDVLNAFPHNKSYNTFSKRGQNSDNNPMSAEGGAGTAIGPLDPAVGKYEDYLASLDGSDIKSIPLGKDFFLKEFSRQTEKTSSEALRDFMAFYFNTIRNVQETFASKADYQKVLWEISEKSHNYDDPVGMVFVSTDTNLMDTKIKNKDVLAELYEYRRSGIRFAPGGEGTAWYLAEDPDFIISLASGISGAYSEFLRLYYPDTKIPWIGDASLGLGWGELSDRIVRWDKFARSNPTLPETKEMVRPELANYISVFSGKNQLDNTPIFTTNGEILPDLKNAYETFLREHTDSECYQDIKNAYEELKGREPKQDTAFDAILLQVEKAKEGETIAIPAGKYNVDFRSGFVIKNKKGLIIKGEPGKTELVSRSVGQAILTVINSTDIVVDGLTVYHNVSGRHQAAGVYIEKSESITVKNSDIGDAAWGVAAMSRENKNIIVVGNKIHDCLYSGVDIITNGGEISHNTFYRNSQDIFNRKLTGLKIFDNDSLAKPVNISE